MKFGVREIVDVVFKATEDNQKVGTKVFKKYQPVFKIDTATTSSLEQATTVVYAKGGKGYANLIAWEGEKTMTFTVTDALMSPMGLAVLSGAGLISPADAPDGSMHVHMTIDKKLNANGEVNVNLKDLQAETGLNGATSFAICKTIESYATKLDGSGAGIAWFDDVTVSGEVGTDDYVTVDADHSAKFTVASTEETSSSDITVQLDFYLIMNNKAAVQEINIEPDSFGGYFYVEAQTLFRREDSGQDMAAEFIIPKAKVQSAFTFTMAASGDPSTFDFVMDAMPGYVRFDTTKKIMCKIQILGTDESGTEESGHTHTEGHLPNPVSPTIAGFNKASASKVSENAAGLPTGASANQALIDVTGTNKNIVIEVAGGVAALDNTIEPKTGWGQADWVVLDYDTGEATIEGLNYINRGTTTPLGPEDVQDATDLGLPAGHMAVWVKASVAKTTPATFSLEKDGNIINVTISVKEVAAG